MNAKRAANPVQHRRPTTADPNSLSRIGDTLRHFIYSVIRGRQLINEHFVPLKGLDLEPYLKDGNTNAVHHIIRYQWAARIIETITSRPDKVLDIACGSGYGTHALAKLFPQIRFVGVDYDYKSTVFAIKHFHEINLSFIGGNAEDWSATIGSDTFDVIICFDTLEHLRHRELFLESVVHNIKQDGIFLLSTPCGGNNTLNPAWKHHMVEYSCKSLYDFLKRYFDVVQSPDHLGTDFPGINTFNILNGSPVSYMLVMNPVICRQPRYVDNPYR